MWFQVHFLFEGIHKSFIFKYSHLCLFTHIIISIGWYKNFLNFFMNAAIPLLHFVNFLKRAALCNDWFIFKTLHMFLATYRQVTIKKRSLLKKIREIFIWQFIDSSLSNMYKTSKAKAAWYGNSTDSNNIRFVFYGVLYTQYV